MKTYSPVGTERLHQSPPTKETIFLLVRLMDQVYKIGVLIVGLQMLSNPYLSLSSKHGQGYSYEHAHK
jgi:hypothetical protein